MVADVRPNPETVYSADAREDVKIDLPGSPMRARSLVDSFRYAFAGLSYAVRTQRNVRIDLVVSLLVFVLGLFLRISAVEWAILAVCIVLVLSVELVNTALEAVVDLASPELHPLACVAKDVAAAAVLLAAITALIVGALVLGPHVVGLLN